MDMEKTIGEQDTEKLRQIMQAERDAAKADPREELLVKLLGENESQKQATRAVPQTPSVCRMVHYVAYGTPGGESPAGAHRAAVITEVDPIEEHRSLKDPVPPVGLCILNPTGLFFNRHIPYDGETHAPGTWHFPEVVFGTR